MVLFPADLSINDIYEEVIKKDGGVGMDLDRVQTSLEQLGCETLATDMESYSIGTFILFLPFILMQPLSTKPPSIY